MSAVTALPVLPPNWKEGVGNSWTNSNPAREHRPNVRKCALRSPLDTIVLSKTQMPSTEERCKSNKLFMHHLWFFLQPGEDKEPFSKLLLHPLPTHFHFVCTSLQQKSIKLSVILLQLRWSGSDLKSPPTQSLHRRRPTRPSLSNILIKTWRRHKVECLQNQMKPLLILKRLEDLSVVYAKVKCCCKDWKVF